MTDAGGEGVKTSLLQVRPEGERGSANSPATQAAWRFRTGSGVRAPWGSTWTQEMSPDPGPGPPSSAAPRGALGVPADPPPVRCWALRILQRLRFPMTGRPGGDKPSAESPRRSSIRIRVRARGLGGRPCNPVLYLNIRRPRVPGRAGDGLLSYPSQCRQPGSSVGLRGESSKAESLYFVAIVRKLGLAQFSLLDSRGYVLPGRLRRPVEATGPGGLPPTCTCLLLWFPKSGLGRRGRMQPAARRALPHPEGGVGLYRTAPWATRLDSAQYRAGHGQRRPGERPGASERSRAQGQVHPARDLGREGGSDVGHPGLGEGRTTVSAAAGQDPGAGSREQGAGSPEPGSRSRELGAGIQEPGAEGQEPESRSWEPGDRRREPQSRIQEPGAEGQEPEVGSQELGAEGQDPGAGIQEPGSRGQQPGSRSWEPGA